MATTRVFMSGNSQAVRIPKELAFDVDEVEILKRGDEIVLRKPRESLAEAFYLLANLDIFPEDRPFEGEYEKRAWSDD